MQDTPEKTAAALADAFVDREYNQQSERTWTSLYTTSLRVLREAQYRRGPSWRDFLPPVVFIVGAACILGILILVGGAK